MFDSLQPHGPQQDRLFHPLLPPRVFSNSCPLFRLCHPTISSSATSFSSCPRSFPASGSFSMSRIFASGGQSTGASASATVLPMNIQGWFPLGWTGLILQSKGLSGYHFQLKTKDVEVVGVGVDMWWGNQSGEGTSKSAENKGLVSMQIEIIAFFADRIPLLFLIQRGRFPRNWRFPL